MRVMIQCLPPRPSHVDLEKFATQSPFGVRVELHLWRARTSDIGRQCQTVKGGQQRIPITPGFIGRLFLVALETQQLQGLLCFTSQVNL